jgi:uncharacterized protein
MNSRAIAIILTLLVLIAPIASCQQDYPVLEYYVTDLTGSALYSFEITDIGQLCEYVYEQTGAQMAVLVVNTTQPDDINTFATKTFQQNQLGQEGKDNGLLIVIATDEKLWRVEVGYGLEGYLPDSLVGSYAEEYLLPPMSYGDFGTGIYDLVNNLGGIILEDYVGEPIKNPYPISFIPLTWNQWVIVIGVMLFLAVITKGRIIMFLPWLFSGGKIGGGGRSGGGGAGGKW